MSDLDFPDSPGIGDRFDEWVWDGEKWIAARPTDVVHVGPTAPADPGEGQLWWDLTTRRLFLFDGGQWRPTSSTTTTGAEPLDPNAGDFWFEGGQLAIWNGTQWVLVADAYANVPIGAITDWATNTPPPRWLACKGQALSRTTYALLFAVLGTQYGAGDGSTTFNLPDYRGRTAIGLDEDVGGFADRVTTGISGIDARTVGAGGGDQRLAAHAHGITDVAHNHVVRDPTHAHSLPQDPHAHGLGDPGHGHTVHDPSHLHGVGATWHSHGFSDPGHAHGVYDPSHNHRTASGGANFYVLQQAENGWQTSGYAPGGGWSMVFATDTWSEHSGTGVAIYGAGTGAWVDAAHAGSSTDWGGTGIWNYGSGTGMWMDAQYAWISCAAAGTGIWLDGSGSGLTGTNNAGNGNAANMPPAIVVAKIIYAGV